MNPNSITAISSGNEAFAPNLMTIIRDKAHASRRILQRPWSCDDFLSAVANVLFYDPGSVAQLVQHSDELRALYADAGAKSSQKFVGRDFSTLRAAKHRFESLCTPLSRICLDWEACISFLVRVSTERGKDRPGVMAAAGLQALNAELMLTAALLADAAAESIILIKQPRMPHNK